MGDKIAITGMACRLPGARDVAEFWDSMMQERTAVTRSGPKHWNGMLEDIEMFDAGRFGIPAADADAMDPQQRMLLEVVHDAIEDAGVAPGSLAGTRTGVFVAQHGSDYAALQRDHLGPPDMRWMLGTHSGVTPGRLSFALDLVGPSVNVDSACSSSLAALHMALCSLRCDDCDRAIVGTANLALTPVADDVFRGSGLSAADGRSKFAETGADGFARSDGVVAVVLRPLDAALDDGERVRAVVLGSAIANNGRGNGRNLLTPSRPGQADMLRAAYRRAGVDPSTVDYVEAHGAGTPAGDAAELGALGGVVGAVRPRGRPCLVGSAKTTVGHTEGAAGLTGLVRATLCLERSAVPPSARAGADLVPMDDGLSVPRAATPLTPGGRPAVAGVNAFGATGTAVHVVLEQAPATPAPAPHRNADGALLLLSAGTEDGVSELAGRYRDLLAPEAAAAPALEDVAVAAATRRDRHPHRIAVAARTGAQAAARLAGVAEGLLPEGAHRGTATGEPPRVTFVFSGHGSQWAGMGRDLSRREPAFAEALSRCDEAVRAVAGWSVIDALRTGDPADGGGPGVTQPMLWAVQVALAETWRAWGVQPDAVVGHSVGEAAAAYVAGALDLHDAAAVVCHRSLLLERLRGTGAMLVADLPEAAATDLAAELGGDLVIAARNAPRRVVLSGSPADVRRCADRLADAGVAHGRLDIDLAAHGPHTAALTGELRERLAGLRPRAAALPLHSTVHGADPAVLDAGYWADNLRRPVDFVSAMTAALAPTAAHTVVEIAAHPILTPSIEDVAAHAGRPALVVGSLRRGAGEREPLLDSLGALFVAGVEIGVAGVATAAGGGHVELPTYPWRRSAHWLAPPAPSPAELRPAAPSRTTTGQGPSPSVTCLPHPPTRPSGRGEQAAGHLHRVWRREDAARSAAGVGDELHGRWVLVGPPAACTRTARVLQARGATVVTVPTTGADWPARARHGATSTDCRGVVYLDAPVRSGHAGACDAMLDPMRLVQALPTADLPLYLVTTGAHQVHDGETGLDPFASPVWGLGQVIDTERPELRCRAIDLEPGSDLSGTGAVPATHLAVRALADELARPGRADVALRGRDRYVRELALGTTRPSGLGGPVRPDGTYVITGGLGGLGLLTARVLVDLGARHLLLLGRGGVRDRDARQILGEPAATGADVCTERVDVTDRDLLTRALDRARGRGPLRGVLHTAAEFHDAAVADMDPVTLRAATAAKADGAWNLHLATADDDLDLFVLYSSVAVHTGGEGVTAYVAANEFLNGLARYRAARGLPATSVGWGVVDRTGCVLRNAELARTLHRDGHVGISPERFADELGRLLRDRPVEATVADVDWPRWAAVYPQLAVLPRYRRLVPATAGTVRGAPGRAPATDPAGRRPVPEVVARLVSRVLGQRDGDPVRAGEQGVVLDSLGAAALRVALREQLGVSVPAGELVGEIDLAALCDRLGDELGRAAESPDHHRAGPPAASAGPPARPV